MQQKKKRLQIVVHVLNNFPSQWWSLSPLVPTGMTIITITLLYTQRAGEPYWQTERQQSKHQTPSFNERFFYSFEPACDQKKLSLAFCGHFGVIADTHAFSTNILLKLRHFSLPNIQSKSEKRPMCYSIHTVESRVSRKI